MAIVKASYTKSKGAAKANVRYITHRAGKDGEKITRPLFGFDGPLTKDQVYQRIDEVMKGTHFYRLKLATDPRKEDWDKQLDLEEVTKEAIRELERKLFEETGVRMQLDFVAAIHDDHTNIRHVHVLTFVKEKLLRSHLQALTKGATQEAREQRQDLDKALGIGAERTVDRPPVVASLPPKRGGDLLVGKPGRRAILPEAPPCPRCDTQMAFLGTYCACSNCGLRFALEKELRLGREAGSV